MAKQKLRRLPSVDRLLADSDVHPLVEACGHDLTVAALRAALEAARARIRAGEDAPEQAALVSHAGGLLADWTRPRPQPVINATGVIVHTNLGRAPLSEASLRAVQTAAAGYCDLEYDLEAGARGHRMAAVEDLLCRVTGAEAALAVNNNAGAVLLALAALACGREVVISRGQLIEIGGGFRIPEVLAQSGARLVEVGTTNRTHRRDYENALSEDTAAILRAHSSNFRIIGFTSELDIAELVEIGHEVGRVPLTGEIADWRTIPVIDDLGSGALLDTAAYGLAHEPTVQESLQAGAALVCFSGDKLLGGPQAGVIVGRKDTIDRLKTHPLARALRADKLCLAALSATLTHYLKGEAAQCVPVWQMIAAPLGEIERRARRWARQLKTAGIQAEPIPGQSTVGGGSLPGEALPTRLLAIRCDSPDAAASQLRRNVPPVVARIEAEHLVLDPRTVLPGQDKALLAALERAFQGANR
ncbi:MAG: L-seryl-tRNA(Sec) selenium transferase [Thermoflexales bacterium]|nr:L-seryl-tRNA(Sec) selenium transferase [Thermoflexales bacterium]